VIFEAAIKQGFEGIIAKLKDSTYESGKRSRNWLKIKATLSDEFVIGGYSQGSGSRAHTFGALLLGYHDDKGLLAYVGHVGTGFDEPTLVDLRKRLDALKTDQCPFAAMPPLNAPTTWVRPELVAEVKFTQWTQDGYLRTPVFMRLREDKAPTEVQRLEVVPSPDAAPEEATSGKVGRILEQLDSPAQNLTVEVDGHKISLTNLDKELWPATSHHHALTKRDLLVYLTRASPYILPHLRGRPLSLSRYPDGIYGEHFYQKHWTSPLPEFVETVRLPSEHSGPSEYLVCNNISTLLWLGQLANLEFHTWFSRTTGQGRHDSAPGDANDKGLSGSMGYPDFIIFDLDPYLYSGNESKGAEPELNPRAFSKACEVARWLKDVLDNLSLSAFVKTSGKTGLHIYVPIARRFDYRSVRSAAETISRYLLQQHPQDITLDWAVEKRAGKVFMDYNQNVQGKTLASAYSPRPTPEATVSVPLRWDELGKVYPTDFTILTTPRRIDEMGDLWANILEAKRDLRSLLQPPDTAGTKYADPRKSD